MGTKSDIRRLSRQTSSAVVESEAEVRAAPHARLLDVARDLFCRDGIHATGIDRILAEAGVSKMTLYSRFGSKDALVREVLREEGKAWRAQFVRLVTGAADTPEGQLRGVIVALESWFGGGRFYGCAFMNAVAEHAKGEAWLRDLAAEHHQQTIGFLGQLATEAGYAEPVMLARQILLVIDGAIAAFMVTGDTAVLDLTRRNLYAVLAAAVRAEA